VTKLIGVGETGPVFYSLRPGSKAGSPWSVTCVSVTCVSQSNHLCCHTQDLSLAVTLMQGMPVGAIRKQDDDWPPRCCVAALPLCRVLSARAITLHEEPV